MQLNYIILNNSFLSLYIIYESVFFSYCVIGRMPDFFPPQKMSPYECPSIINKKSYLFDTRVVLQELL